MCAILGLRTIYTLSVLLIRSFRYLQHAVALLLAFVGVKIVLDVIFGIAVSTRLSLLAIVATLGTGVLASCLVGKGSDQGGSDGWSSDQGKDERVKE